MNTRQFLKTLLAIGVAPSVLIPQYNDHYQWIKTDEGIWVLNPEYENAEFEILSVPSKGLPYSAMILHRRGEPGTPLPDGAYTMHPHALRFSMEQVDNGIDLRNPIPQFIKL